MREAEKYVFSYEAGTLNDRKNFFTVFEKKICNLRYGQIWFTHLDIVDTSTIILFLLK